MFVVRPKSGQWIAVYGPDKRLLGTMKLLLPGQNGQGGTGIMLDFPKEIRFDINYGKPQIATVVESGVSSTFGDYEPPDYDVPLDVDNC